MTDNLSSIPLYIQVKNAIKEKIHANVYTVGQKIPSEPDLEEEYGVSRVTVRKAINELVDENFLVKKQGKGTFVNHKTVKRKLSYVLGFSKSCLNEGLVPSSEILEKKLILPSEEIARKLRISPSEKVIYIKRKRYADEVAIFLENNYFVYRDYQFLMELDKELTGSLYEILETKGIYPKASEQKTLEIAVADSKMAKEMSVPIGTPFFYLNVVILDQDNIPVHVGHQYYLGDYYKFDM